MKSGNLMVRFPVVFEVCSKLHLLNQINLSQFSIRSQDQHESIINHGVYMISMNERIR